MKVVAVVPAFNSDPTIAATVRALEGVVSEVVVVDDGSTDSTARRAEAAGASVISLGKNYGKGAAMTAGLAHCGDADIVAFVDADTEASAAAVGVLVDAVLSGEVDLAVGVLPGAGRNGGFGLVRNTAAAFIRRACGFESRAPLSGQRAMRVNLARSLAFASRFGVEVAMTIDAVRAGARVREMDVDMTHRHRGRGTAGFLHRGRQGLDVLRVGVPRLFKR